MTRSQHSAPTSPVRRLRRASAALASAAAIAMALGACSSPSSETGSGSGDGGDLGEISIQLSWIKNIEFAGEYFADSKGYYADAGFSGVTLIAGGGDAASAESAVLSGDAIVGLSSPLGTAPAVADEGAPLKIIGTTYQKNPFTILSLADKADIASPEDMIGKTIGVQTGVNETLFKGLLAANDIDESEVTIKPVQYDPTVLTTDPDLDGFMAYITNEPIILEAQGFDTTTFLFADYNMPFVAESFVVLQETIDDQRDLLKAFLLAEIKGWKDAVADPEGAAKLAVDQYGKDLGLVLEEQIAEATAQNDLIVSADTDANGLFTMTDELIDENMKVLADAGYDVTADQIFDLSLLDEVYEENPDLIG